MKILMVLTSHNQLGDTGTGAEIALASPAGDQPLVDTRSEESQNQTPTTTRFNAARAALAYAANLSSVVAPDCDAVFYPGGHGPVVGPCRRFAVDPIDRNDTRARGKPVAAVCHAAGAFRHTHPIRRSSRQGEIGQFGPTFPPLRIRQRKCRRRLRVSKTAFDLWC